MTTQRDLIDFPCSPDWVRHYAEMGMTQDYPAAFYERAPQAATPQPPSEGKRLLVTDEEHERVVQLEATVEEQAREIARLSRAISYLEEQARRKAPDNVVPLSPRSGPGPGPVPVPPSRPRPEPRQVQGQPPRQKPQPRKIALRGIEL